MSRNKYSSFTTAERVWKTLFKENVTVLLLVLLNNVNISRLNWIGRQLQPVELAAGELAVNWQTTSAWFADHGTVFLFYLRVRPTQVSRVTYGMYFREKPFNFCGLGGRQEEDI